eukprot:TRINITY_DN48037_c0_g1_i1.p1 TRINITY_DN48037_c0_g1~~TRINITY_DN48037_c0_g1_i1.p1  ORF type:complete len:167 (+),score=17.02 TRINITY_DN48037_c0_g1_i1:200-700(+)
MASCQNCFESMCEGCMDVQGQECGSCGATFCCEHGCGGAETCRADCKECSEETCPKCCCEHCDLVDDGKVSYDAHCDSCCARVPPVWSTQLHRFVSLKAKLTIKVFYITMMKTQILTVGDLLATVGSYVCPFQPGKVKKEISRPLHVKQHHKRPKQGPFYQAREGE